MAVITTKSKSSATMHGPVNNAIDAIALAHPSQSREVRLLQGPRNWGNLSAKAFLLVSSRRGHRRIRTAGTFHHLAAIILPEYVTQAERVQHVRTCSSQQDVGINLLPREMLMKETRSNGKATKPRAIRGFPREV